MSRSSLVNPLQTPGRRSRGRRALLWGSLVSLLLVAQTLLVTLTVAYESARAQEAVESVAAETAAEVRHDLIRLTQTLQALTWADTATARADAAALMKTRRDLRRLEWRGPAREITAALDSPYQPPLFSALARSELAFEAEVACDAARRASAPTFSRSYFVPMKGGIGVEVFELCLPAQRAGRDAGTLVATFALAQVLEASTATPEARHHEFSFIEGDGTRLARAGAARGAGVYVADRVVDLPGGGLQLRADSATLRPSLIPNLSTALVVGLSIMLFGVVLMLARDVRRRAVAERALAEALGFRKAMEDSLSTGLRARDLQGAITYVNPAFCAMVGFSAEELRDTGHAQPQAGLPSPPYWPPEYAAEYLKRQQRRIEGDAAAPADSRGGVETVFMRKNGERFPVMVYEAPLVDGEGRQTGWMSAVVDLSAQRRVEDISRQQQERLQASARLATVGEMASLLSHELNQPLAAIASYAAGSLNLLADQGAASTPLLQQALQRIAEQAERAGRVIKSVHSFVRRREQAHETMLAQHLFDDVLPLVKMQARKNGARIEVDLPPGPPLRVRCDRTMVEQVLLNLARNGIQAMDDATPDPADRVLTLRARQHHPRWVTLSVVDAGAGIAPEVAAQLFTPFFTTKPEGMGLGLSLCRTVIEQHGGALDFGPGDGGRGTEFRFTLPAVARPETSETPGTSAFA